MANVSNIYCRNFLNIKCSVAKIEIGVFDELQIRKLFQDPIFETKMNKVERAAWVSFKKVAKIFLGNRKCPQHKEIVKRMVNNYNTLK